MLRRKIVRELLPRVRSRRNGLKLVFVMQSAEDWRRPNTMISAKRVAGARNNGIGPTRIGQTRTKARVGAASIVQVDNPTPIILSHEKSVIHGIHGVVVLSLCMRCSSNTGIPCAGAVSRRNGTVRL